MIDYAKLGQIYGRGMTKEGRAKAMLERTEARSPGKAMVSIVVGGKSGQKALVMSAAQFEQFKKGFVV